MDHDFMDYFHEKIIQRFIMLYITSLLWAGSYVIDFQTESVLAHYKKRKFPIHFQFFI